MGFGVELLVGERFVYIGISEGCNDVILKMKYVPWNMCGHGMVTYTLKTRDLVYRPANRDPTMALPRAEHFSSK